MLQVDEAQKKGEWLTAKTLLSLVRRMMQEEMKRKQETAQVKMVEQQEDPYLLQRLALATYKSKSPNEEAALMEAHQLLNILNPGTLLFGDVKGQPYAKTLDQYFDGVANRQSPKDSGKPFKGTIISIDVVNSIAVARVHVKMYDFNYDEFLSFHKINNRWMIVNKMITDVAE